MLLRIPLFEASSYSFSDQGPGGGRINGREGFQSSGVDIGSKKSSGKLPLNKKFTKCVGVIGEVLERLFHNVLGNPIAASIPISVGEDKVEVYSINDDRRPSNGRRVMVLEESSAR